MVHFLSVFDTLVLLGVALPGQHDQCFKERQEMHHRKGRRLLRHVHTLCANLHIVGSMIRTLYLDGPAWEAVNAACHTQFVTSAS